MARTNIVKDFDLSFEINFKTMIRGHHVYKSIWKSSIGQVLLAQPDQRKKALDYDKYDVGIFKRHEEDISKLSLVGHVPVELSKLLNQFLKADTGIASTLKSLGNKNGRLDLSYQQSPPSAQNVVEQKESSMSNC